MNLIHKRNNLRSYLLSIFSKDPTKIWSVKQLQLYIYDDNEYFAKGSLYQTLSIMANNKEIDRINLGQYVFSDPTRNKFLYNKYMEIDDILNSTIIKNKINYLESLNYTGRPGYPPEKLMIVFLIKYLLRIDQWEKTLQYIHVNYDLRDKIYYNDKPPSIFVVYRFAKKIENFLPFFNLYIENYYSDHLNHLNNINLLKKKLRLSQAKRRNLSLKNDGQDIIKYYGNNISIDDNDINELIEIQKLEIKRGNRAWGETSKGKSITFTKSLNAIIGDDFSLLDTLTSHNNLSDNYEIERLMASNGVV